jgi:hypothetical protein
MRHSIRQNMPVVVVWDEVLGFSRRAIRDGDARGAIPELDPRVEEIAKAVCEVVGRNLDAEVEGDGFVGGACGAVGKVARLQVLLN